MIQGDYYRPPTGCVAALDADTPFPPIDCALKDPNGLIAIGGDLSAARILSAYQQGIFPWFSEGEPILWWSPDPRMVLFPDELKISKSLAKRLKKNDYTIQLNHHFLEVMSSCAAVSREDQAGTWISPAMIEAYCELHAMGHAICAETWIDGELVGGLYGVIINRMFYGESMFHTKTDASKIAFVLAVQYLKKKGIKMIDCQMKTKHLLSFGAKEITRNQFIQLLNNYIKT